MKKKIILGVVISIVLIVGIGGKFIVDDIKAQQRSVAAVNSVVEGKANSADINYNSLGKYGPYTQELIESITKINNDLEQYDLESNKYLESIVAPKFLENPSEGKKDALEVSEFMNNYLEVLKQDFEQLYKVIERAPLNPSQKQELGKSVEDQKNKINQQFDEVSKIMSSLTSKSNALYDFLLSRKGKYSVQGDQIQFYSQQDVDDYNKLIKDIQLIDDEIEAIEEKQ